ncbi:DUF4931 domain-containing protein [Candidatus Micrarchaeota archaeon]|nr:DUF4931 domain-containing protein [Candidatus Micrarchaeota archaeon]
MKKKKQIKSKPLSDYIFPEHKKMPENEFRIDCFNRCVIYTVNRSKRPQQFSQPKVVKSTKPADCVFCQGNESKTPKEICRYEERGKWQIRVIPNKFYGVHPAYEKAYGRHEVIIETPEHFKTFSEITPKQTVKLFEIFQERYAAHMADKKVKSVMIFKNEGPLGGASLEHTHWQLVSSDILYPENDKYVEYFKNYPEEQLKRWLDSEKERFFYKNKNVVVFCPYVSKFNFEVWVVPKKLSIDFEKMTKEEIKDFAMATHKAIGAIDKMLNFPSYNIVLFPSEKGENLQTHIQIYPRISNWAGFEYGTNCAFNSVLPEVASQELKKNIKR